MNEIVEREARTSALDEFAKRERNEANIAPPAIFAAPAERIFGAQRVAVQRDESEILRKIKVLAAAAGEDWFYRYPVRRKVVDQVTGREKWVTDYVEGPSIKCANNVARLYGNCDIDVREFDVGTHWVYYARFIDLETGYSLTRPFRQRKSQRSMKTDAGRQEDIVYQIGASKAIRNVVCNALEFFAAYAADEAKASIVEKVAARADHYRERIVKRVADLKIDLKRIEVARGRPIKEWSAADLARTIAELQAIQDGMTTPDEIYPTGDQPPAAEPEPAQQVVPSAEQKPDVIGIATQRGWDARKAGMQRRAIPPEYRDPKRKEEADAWLAGYDRRVQAETDEEPA